MAIAHVRADAGLRPGREAQGAAPIAVDGSYGEGGGQLVRTAVALAAVTGRTLRLDNIRATRKVPGLAPQHLTAIAAVGALCDARIDGLALRSTALTFVPGPLRGGDFRFDVGTAGSLTLVLQALLPALVGCGERASIVLRGGTDVRMAPPLDYFREVTLPLLAQLGVRATLDVRRRGYYPRGGGEIALTVLPSRLRPVTLVERGALVRIRGLAHVARIDAAVAQRMREAFLANLGAPDGIVPAIDEAVLASELAFGTGGAIVAWAECGRTRLGAGRVAERGVRAEALGAAVAAELRADLDASCALDIHAADQLPSIGELLPPQRPSLKTRPPLRHVTCSAETMVYLTAARSTWSLPSLPHSSARYA